MWFNFESCYILKFVMIIFRIMNIYLVQVMQNHIRIVSSCAMESKHSRIHKTVAQ